MKKRTKSFYTKILYQKWEKTRFDSWIAPQGSTSNFVPPIASPKHPSTQTPNPPTMGDVERECEGCGERTADVTFCDDCVEWRCNECCAVELECEGCGEMKADVTFCDDCYQGMCKDCSCRDEVCVDCDTTGFCKFSGHCVYECGKFFYFCPAHTKCPVCEENDNDLYWIDCNLCGKSPSCCEDCANSSEDNLICRPCVEKHKGVLSASVSKSIRSLPLETREDVLRCLGLNPLLAHEFAHPLKPLPTIAGWILGLNRWKTRALEKHYAPGGLGWARSMESLDDTKAYLVMECTEEIRKAERHKRYLCVKSEIAKKIDKVIERITRVGNKCQCTFSITCERTTCFGLDRCHFHWNVCTHCRSLICCCKNEGYTWL